jgi:ADP-ribose pyrophosphatase YjhB (NUDIX family)
MKFDYCPSCGHKGTVQKFDDTNYECSNCKWHFWNNTKACMALVFIKDGQALFARRGREPFKGKYDFPGGFVDFGETVIEASIREAKEELGVIIKPQDMHLVTVYANGYLYKDTHVYCADLVYVVRKWKGEFAAMDDVAAVSWKPFSFIDGPEFAVDYSGLSEKLTAITQITGE